MSDEADGVPVPFDVLQLSPALQKDIDNLTASIDEQTAGTRERIASVGTGFDDWVLPGLREALQHLDPVVLRSTATIADALARARVREQFMLRAAERARTDPEFAQEAARAEAAVRADPSASASVQRLMDEMHKRPEFFAKLKGELPVGLAPLALFSAVSMGLSVAIMASDGFSETDQVQITSEIVEQAPDFLPYFERKRGGNAPEKDED